MTAQDVTALPDALLRLAVALDEVLRLAGLAQTPQPAPPVLRAVPDPAPARAASGARWCRWCHHPMPDDMRVHAEYCSAACRKTAWRARTRRRA